MNEDTNLQAIEVSVDYVLKDYKISPEDRLALV